MLYMLTTTTTMHAFIGETGWWGTLSVASGAPNLNPKWYISAGDAKISGGPASGLPRNRYVLPSLRGVARARLLPRRCPRDASSQALRGGNGRSEATVDEAATLQEGTGSRLGFDSMRSDADRLTSHLSASTARIEGVRDASKQAGPAVRMPRKGTPDAVLTSNYIDFMRLLCWTILVCHVILISSECPPTDPRLLCSCPCANRSLLDPRHSFCPPKSKYLPMIPLFCWI